jgi:hypothetical protein
VELANACETAVATTEQIETALGVSHRRARETILEAVRVGLLSENGDSPEARYSTTDVGVTFLDAIRRESWGEVSSILQNRSPHYGTFLDAVAEIDPAEPSVILERLKEEAGESPYDFNQTSIDVLGDWGERLGAIQRNAFTGTYYRPTPTQIPSTFPTVLLSVFGELEQTAGVNLSQRYLSIPELREHLCERLRSSREAFDEALVTLANQNVGKIELSGAPIDTGAKTAKLGIKQIELADDGGLVSTTQSTDLVMSGVAQHGKQYYYLAVHDEDLQFTQESHE